MTLLKRATQLLSAAVLIAGLSSSVFAQAKDNNQDADRQKKSRTETFARIWEAAHVAAEREAPGLRVPTRPAAVPFLSEPWYCCAEPTKDQFISIHGAATPKAREASVGAEGFV